jgi:hypothetical protein
MYKICLNDFLREHYAKALGLHGLFVHKSETKLDLYKRVVLLPAVKATLLKEFT